MNAKGNIEKVTLKTTLQLANTNTQMPLNVLLIKSLDIDVTIQLIRRTFLGAKMKISYLILTSSHGMMSNGGQHRIKNLPLRYLLQLLKYFRLQLNGKTWEIVLHNDGENKSKGHESVLD